MTDYINTAIAVLSPFLIVWIVTVFLSARRYSRIDKELLRNDVLLKKAIKCSNAWLFATSFWMLVEYILVVAPFVANSIVIYQSLNSVENKESILVYSVASSAFIVFGYAINPQRHKKCYRKAFVSLDKQIDHYLIQTGTNSHEKESLAKAISDGEGFIGNSYDME